MFIQIEYKLRLVIEMLRKNMECQLTINRQIILT